MKIELGKKYTSGGQPVHILCTDRPHQFGQTVVGMRDDGVIVYFNAIGDSSLDSKYDLQEVWEPKEGEWCWFWDKGNYDSLNLSRIMITNKSKKFYSYSLRAWDCCAKFDGTFPEHLKENK